MKKFITPLIALLLLAGSAFAFIAATNWKIAAGYKIAWSTTGDAAGIFKDFDGNITFDGGNLAASKFDVTIQTASLNTGNGLMNTHAKSAEWFDVKKYPTIQFASKSITKAGNGYQVTGDLSMHGVTKSITIPFQFQQSGANAGTFTGKFNVNRLDFKLGKPGDVDESISVEISVPVNK